MKILLHTPFSRGGIADYARRQADALHDAGHEVIHLVPENFYIPEGSDIRNLPLLPNLDSGEKRHPILRRIRWVRWTWEVWKILNQETGKQLPDAVLLSAFAEYLAPLWSGQFHRLRKKHPGIVFGAVVHDPVRKQLGPAPLHRWTISRAYRILDVAFLHSPVSTTLSHIPPHLNIRILPHGVSGAPHLPESSDSVRGELGIPDEAILLFAFGHIRDSKNLDLAVSLLPSFPNLHLLIAGKVTSSQDRPAASYRKIAHDLGVSARLTLLDRFISDEEAARFFSASDYILLSYDERFVSASGVLHQAIHHRRPALATSGDGHLKWAVETYQLGVWTRPDSLSALREAMQELVDSGGELAPRWDDYTRENTWEKNASIIAETFQETERQEG